MPDRVAVLSDIHGVLPALEAVLAEPDVAAADLIVLTGDLAAGPQPVEVLDRLAALVTDTMAGSVTPECQGSGTLRVS